MTVQGKVVIITGGAQGIGRYVARTFAAEGANIAVADIAPMDTVVAEVEELGAEILPIKTDVTDEAQVKSMVEQVYRRWGRIDVLINDAGIVTHFAVGGPRWPGIRDMPREFFQKVIDTNLVGTFLCTKHVLPYMESLYEGHIINFGQGRLTESPLPEESPDHPPNVGSCIYAVSKIAIRAFTRSVAVEERRYNICIMSVGPGTEGSGGPLIGAGLTRAGIITDDSPEWAHEAGLSKRVETVGNRYVLAAEAGMEFSGHQVALADGQLTIARDRE